MPTTFGENSDCNILINYWFLESLKVLCLDNNSNVLLFCFWSCSPWVMDNNGGDNSCFPFEYRKTKTNVIIVVANCKQCRQFNASAGKRLLTNHNQFAFTLDFLKHLMLYTKSKQILITFDIHMKKYSYYKSAVPFLLTVVQSSSSFPDAPLNVYNQTIK